MSLKPEPKTDKKEWPPYGKAGVQGTRIWLKGQLFEQNRATLNWELIKNSKKPVDESGG